LAILAQADRVGGLEQMRAQMRPVEDEPEARELGVEGLAQAEAAVAGCEDLGPRREAAALAPSRSSGYAAR
jgi:hypothetical protein